MKSSPIAVAALTLLALTACGPGTPPSGDSPSVAPTTGATPSGSATSEPDGPEGTDIIVGSAEVKVVDVSGDPVTTSAYDGEPELVVEAFGLALGVEPTISTTEGDDGGCSADQTEYDFGGFLIRSPGHIGSTGTFEVEVTEQTTDAGIPIFTTGGVAVGDTLEAFEVAVGPLIELGGTSSSSYVGGDVSNPDDPEFDAIGTLAKFTGGVLVQYNTPHFLFGDC
jgi:hypothetical protein